MNDKKNKNDRDGPEGPEKREEVEKTTAPGKEFDPNLDRDFGLSSEEIFGRKGLKRSPERRSRSVSLGSLGGEGRTRTRKDSYELPREAGASIESVDASAKAGKAPTGEGDQMKPAVAAISISSDESEADTGGEWHTKGGKKRKASASPKTQGEEGAEKATKKKTAEGTKRAGERSLIERIMEKVGYMVEFAKSNNNVHREIKRTVGETMSLVRRAVVEENYRQAEFQKTKENLEERCANQSAEIGRLQKLIRERGVDGQERPDNSVDINNVKLDTYDDFVRIAKAGWTRESYRATEVEVGDPHGRGAEDAMFYLDEDPKRRSRGGKDVLNRHPELNEHEGTRVEGGRYVAAEHAVTYFTQQTQEVKRRKVLGLFLDTSKSEEEVYRDLYHITKKARDLCEAWGIEKVKTVTPMGITVSVFRKMAEAVFHTSTTKVVIRTPRPEKKEADKKERPRKGDAIVVGIGERSFAETLKTLKEGIKDEETLAGIRQARMTAKGDLLLSAAGKGEAIAKKVTEVLKDCKVKLLSDARETPLHIRGIDGVTTGEEIIEAVKRTVEIKHPNALRIKALRPASMGSQVAVVSLETADAKRLLEHAQLRIGFSVCRVEDRVDVIRCYRCWGYGHRSYQCKDEDRVRLCQNCAGAGHQRATCEAEPYCPLCKQTGHQAGWGRCPQFKEALKNARAGKKKRARREGRAGN